MGHRRDRGFVERGIGTTLTGLFRLVVTDLPTIQEPGSPGTTWRMPAQWNRAQGAGQGLHERTRRVPNPGCGGNDVVLGDRYDAQLKHSHGLSRKGHT